MLPLSVEKYMQKQFEVKVSVDGSLSGAKALGNKPQANPKVVKIGGPESSCFNYSIGQCKYKGR